MAISDALRDLLLTRAAALLRPVLVTTDAHGVVRALEGSPAALGVFGLTVGAAIDDGVLALAGMFPIDEPLEIPECETEGGAFVDISARPIPGGAHVLLTDCTDATRQRQDMQQRGNELRLLSRELERRNEFIREVFGRYVSDELVEEILDTEHGAVLRSETRTVTILMNDLRGFTSLCAQLSPTRVVQLLNHFLGSMTEIVLAHGGLIDEFLGDAILAVFGAPIGRPDDARRALQCAIAMQRAMPEVNAWMTARALPPLEMGVAVNTGEVIVGNIGSPRRLKYGVIGSPVNLTARIESYTVGGQILAGASTVAAAGPGVRTHGTIDVAPKGFGQGVTLHDIAGVDALEVPSRRVDAVPLARPIALRLQRVENKQLVGEEFVGTCTKLSRSGGLLSCEAAIPLLANLRIRLIDEEFGALPGELYAKVTGLTELGDERVQVRFTTIPPVLDDYLQWRLAPRSAGA